ncbi:hypothetical protein ABJI51_15755 [Amycolatopsis sp. NEAU-NG30]|uniref:Uncharacterized protein n=1 Tax=Amycolatopsis melonis TaxID=3156488 RepID=A0ABV0LGQ6_9PSEU
MKTVRVLLALPGLAALAWGVVLFVEYALPLRPDVFGTVGWLVGGPLVNDGVVAPLTAVLGLALGRLLPRPWRTPVVTATVITGILAILAFPLLWRPYGTPPTPGLHDGNPALGLALTTATIWLAAILTALITRVIHPDTQTDPPGTQTDRPGTQADRPGTRVDPPDTRVAPPDTRVDPPDTRVDPPITPDAPSITRDAPSITRDAPPVTHDASPGP